MPDYPETPITRDEQYLANALGDDVQMPTPITREEKYLYNIAVNINAGGGVTPADNGKVVVNGQLTEQTARTLTSNDTYDTTTNNSVTVNVPTPTLQSSKSVTIDEAGTVTITPDSGYDAVEEVVVTAEVPSVSELAFVATIEDGETYTFATAKKIPTTGWSLGSDIDIGHVSYTVDGRTISHFVDLVSASITSAVTKTLTFRCANGLITLTFDNGLASISNDFGVSITSIDVYKTTPVLPSA